MCCLHRFIHFELLTFGRQMEPCEECSIPTLYLIFKTFSEVAEIKAALFVARARNRTLKRCVSSYTLYHSVRPSLIYVAIIKV